MRQEKLGGPGQPAIWFRRRQDGKSPLSKLGGRPTLPPEVDWPRHGQTGAPLHFLAQIDLSSLPPPPLRNATEAPTLPKRGLLFFFADMVEEMLWGENGGPFATTRVIFAKQPGPERAPPDDTPDILHAFGERAGGFRTLTVTQARRSASLSGTPRSSYPPGYARPDASVFRCNSTCRRAAYTASCFFKNSSAEPIQLGCTRRKPLGPIGCTS
jgi:hypothetical protein